MNQSVARYSRIADVPGVPQVEWIVDRRRCSYEWASSLRGGAARLVARHGLDAALHGDVVELEGLDGIGVPWLKRRKNARQAQGILREFHGVTE